MHLSLIANSEKATVIRSALLAKADRLQVDTVKPDVKGAGDVLEGQTALTAAMRGRGRIKTEIVWSDDWNRRETLFDNFDTRWKICGHPEITEKVVSERRVEVLRDLAGRASGQGGKTHCLMLVDARSLTCISHAG